MKTNFASPGTALKPGILNHTLATRRRWITWNTVCFFSFVVIRSLPAQPLSVAVSGTEYTTYVEAQGQPTTTYAPVSRTTISSSPISDEIDAPIDPGTFGGPTITHALANAGLFEVSDQTGWGFANASATSQLWFSPLVDQTQIIRLQINAVGATRPQEFTGGQVSLLDLTSDSELWNYNWSVEVGPNVGSGNVPWDPADPSTANFSLDTDFLASDNYELTMQTYSNAGDDTESVQIQLSGLQAVPEPSSVCLILLALAGLPAARSRALP
ncbi:MAG TPA: hypothetical protein VMJ12_05565 [Candidatus Acidoferrales bacterium]|nr:hypothetical protein [Candidatus Acidoferrales bacterium]